MVGFDKLQTRKMKPEKVLGVLREYQDYLLEKDEADPLDLTVNTRIRELSCWHWNDPSRMWVCLAKIFNAVFSIEVPLREWKPVLTPLRKQRVADVCAFISERIDITVIPPVRILGQECHVAGAFRVVSDLLHRNGVDTNDLAPSTALDRFSSHGLPEVYKELYRMEPSLIFRLNPIARSDGWHGLAGLFLLPTAFGLGLVAVGVQMWDLLPYAFLASTLFLLVWHHSKGFVLKIERVQVRGLLTFRDLCQVLAADAKRFAAPGTD